MKRISLLMLLLAFGFVADCQASLFGPWRRYRNETLGVEVPTVDDWVITPLKNCVVFAMQLNPNPYVRLAIGKVNSDPTPFEKTVNEQISKQQLTQVKKTHCVVNGSPAIRVEAASAKGHVLDYYVDRGQNRYWIGFVTDRPERWAEYSKSFDLILSDIKFI